MDNAGNGLGQRILVSTNIWMKPYRKEGLLGTVLATVLATLVERTYS